MFDVWRGNPPMLLIPSEQRVHATVPTFNSCTKWLGNPGHNTQPHAQLPPSFLVTDAWMISQLNVALIGKLHGSLLCLAHFFDRWLSMFLYNQSLADVRSTGAGMKYLHCIKEIRTP